MSVMAMVSIGALRRFLPLLLLLERFDGEQKSTRA